MRLSQHQIEAIIDRMANLEREAHAEAPAMK